MNKKKLYAGYLMNETAASRAAKAVLTGADGVFLLDRSADDAGHDAFMGQARILARQADAPILSGGRVKRLEDVKKYLYAGSTGVFLDGSSEGNTAMVREASDRFGKDRIWLYADDAETLRLLPELAGEGLFGAVIDTEKIDIEKTPVPEAFQGEVMLTSPADPEAVLKRCRLSCSGVVVLQHEGTAGETDFMALKAQLTEAGVAVARLETDITWDQIKKDAAGLLTVVVQDYRTNDVLMVAWMNEEAFRKTLETGRMTYWSRSRKELWLKGETSGHFQFVKSLTLDCDSDTLLAKVFQVGAACHTGSRSCFFNRIAAREGSHKNPHQVFEDVYNVILDRKAHPKEGSYTNYLFDKGIDKILKKVGEEATEIVIAAKNPDPEEVKYEISDFLYHVMVLMAERGVTWDDITQELANR